MTTGNVDPAPAGSDWCPPGRVVTVAGITIRCGAFWFGPGDEPSTVDPYLPVDRGFPDWDAATVTDLRYDRLSPSARAAYLVWLASGRRVPEAPAVWAELYLWGLERRMIADADDDPILAAEARAIGAVYGRSPAVAALVAGLSVPVRPAGPPALDLVTAGPPAELAVEIGRRALAREPVTVEWALAWAWYHPDHPRQDAATQVPGAFASLWRHRFTERHPRGLLVPTRRRRLVLGYEPANPSLPRPLERTIADASDVLSHPTPSAVLAEITDEVEQELQPFARWATRHPERVSGVAAAALLPDLLLAESPAGAAAAPLIEWARQSTSGADPVVASGRQLTSLWTAGGADGRLDKADSVALAQILEKHGVGIEPDVRFGGRPIPPDGPVVLFRIGAAAAAAPSPSYVLAAVTAELCLAVAAADGSVDDAEAGLLADRLDRIEDLSVAERARLVAHRRLVGANAIDLDEVASRARELDEQARRELAVAVTDIAMADGQVEEAERRTVLAVHRLLGVDVSEAEARLAAPGTTDTTEDAGADVVRAGPADPGREQDGAEPSPAVAPAGPPRLVALDEERLARTQASNADVRALLGAIFADDDDEAGDEADDEADDIAEDAAGEHHSGPGSAPSPVELVGSLDQRHSALLFELAEAGAWTRPELEQACSRLAVLPDGALDVVNEAAFDIVGDPVIELKDGGAVAVDREVLEEMRA
ncbi:TerB N-terminal domain-containing protein [Pseudonocardia kongjuensis]|uniref:TerB N-terminal domain-containing protein n=1 Tax=Pseudonocardia kongjuensis TaxID=102227 RepID=UPI0031D1B4D7